MGDSHPIISLGELSKPATVLVEKISEAIGGLARPWQIKRVAEAQAEAERIQAVSQIKITELQRRAMTRLISEEARKQNNIESITAKAVPQLDPGAKPQNVEDDWIAHFFDQCRLTSDEDMQKLWARILAGEANAPGRFSKRTIGLLASMDKVDATMFSKICGFVCSVPQQLTPVVYDYTRSIYKQNGLDFPLLTHLESIGLIRLNFDPLTAFVINGLNQTTVVDYFGQKVYIEFAEGKTAQAGQNELAVGQVLFTKAGEQLAAICEAKPLDEFLEFLKTTWRAYSIPKTEQLSTPQF